MAMKKLNVSQLRKLYVQEKLSTNQVALLLGCSGIGVRDALARNGIMRRAKGEAKHIRNNLDREQRGEPELDYKAVIILYTNGLTANRIATIFKASSQHVLRILRKYEIPIREKRKFCLSPQDREKLEKLYKDGASIASIAKNYNVKASIIFNFLKGHKIWIRKNKKNSDMLKCSKKIETLFKQGMNRYTIASTLGMSSSAVYAYCKKNKLTSTPVKKSAEKPWYDALV